ncbi:hypothetical protein BGX38DRAFT_1086096, partial [Terfezia claveryi]
STLFFSEVKPSGHIHHNSSLEAADLQMRERFRILFDDVEITLLYGVSARGTRLCVYTWNKGTRPITPKCDSNRSNIT